MCVYTCIVSGEEGNGKVGRGVKWREGRCEWGGEGVRM